MRFGKAAPPPTGAVMVYEREIISIDAVAKVQEYGIVTVHDAVDPARAAATPAISEMVLPPLSKVEALPEQEITSALGMLDLTEIEML
jgi:hypothetical protein